MLRRCVLTLSLAMALGAAVQWKASAAPTYICVGLCTGIIVTDPDKPIPEPGKLVNILDVPVNGSLYDVAFVDGRFSEIFGTSSPSLLFTSQTGAELAAQALSNVLVDIGSGGPTSVQAFDSSPKLTRGCSLSLSGGCAIMTPFEVPSFLGGAAFRQVSFANANPFLGVGSADEFLGIPAGLLELAGFDFASDITRTFAVWRVAGGTAPDDPQVRFFTPPAFGEPSTSRVPEPGVLFLMAVGLAGLAASRKTRSRNSRWIPG